MEYLQKYLLIYLGLCWVFPAVRGLPLVAGGGGRSPVGVRRLPTAVASLATEHGSSPRGPVPGAPGLPREHSAVMMCDLLRLGIEPVSLALQGALLNPWTPREAL